MDPRSLEESRRTRQDEAVAHVRTFVDCGLMVDAWLGGLAERRIQPAAERVLREAAEGFSTRYWRPPHRSVDISLGLEAAFHILMVTAAVIAHERVGRISVSQAMAEEARDRLEAFIGRRGFRAGVWVYEAVTRFEQVGALQYHEGLPEADFVRGRHRRPWVEAPLDGELERGLVDGDLRRVRREGQPWIEPTEAGANRHAEMRKVLAEGGFLEARVRLAVLSELNLIPDYETLRRRIIPWELAWRRSFTRFAGVRPGARVLAVGRALGGQVLDSGLVAAVGPAGHITGASPSVAMVDQVRTQARRQHADNVSFVRSALEELPFPDGRFDVVFGLGVVHRPDPHRILAEMIRVTRPGGLVAHGASCAADASPAWLSEWLAPILERAGAAPPHPLPALLNRGDMERWFAAAGLVDVATEPTEAAVVFEDPEASAIALLRTDPLVQGVLGGLPWDAAQALIEEITQRAAPIFRRLSAEERRVSVPVEAVRGRVPPGAPVL